MCVSAMVLVAAAAVSAAQAPAAAELTGKWTMKVSGGPHGDAAMSLVLKQRARN